MNYLRGVNYNFYSTTFTNSGFAGTSTETVTTVSYDENGKPVYEYKQVLVTKDKSGNSIGVQEFGQDDENSQNDDGNNDKKPKFSELSDSEKIVIIVNAINKAIKEGRDYIDLDNLFEEQTIEGNMISTIKIKGC